MHNYFVKPDRNGRYYAIWFVITVCVAGVFVLMTTLVDDGRGIIRGADPAYYFSYVRSIVIDYDLDFANEYDHFGIAINRAPLTDYPINKYSIGFPLLVAPFYILVHATLLMLVKIGYVVDASGFSLPYQYAVSLGSIFYGYLGLVLAYKICARFFSAKNSFTAVTAIFFSSNIFYYFLREPFMAHLASFFSVSLFIHCWLKIRYDRRVDAVAYFALGIGAAAMILVRQQNVAFLSIPAIDLAYSFLSKDCERPRIGIGEVFSFLLAFAPLVFVQLLAWKIIYGSYFTYSYGAEPFIYAGSPRIVEVLFSSRHGLISWTPVISLSLLGLLIFLVTAGGAGTATQDAVTRGNRRFIALLLIAAFLLQLYINASWHMWWLGYAFGARGFINCTAIFAVGLAALMESAGVFADRSLLKFFVPIFALLALWNMIMIIAYMSEMIPYGDYFSWQEFFTNLKELPDAVLRKVGR